MHFMTYQHEDSNIIKDGRRIGIGMHENCQTRNHEEDLIFV
jgi:hypothetical protein